jgi:5-oxoprolinase (ATP-hydrolysing) subunit A
MSISSSARAFIDLNCDLGESYGAYAKGRDEEVLKLVSSANIACGFHAGDPAVMRNTVRLCLENGVSIGAHPGLPDLQGFGRREIRITPDEAYEMTLYQIGALDAFVRAEGGRLHHVKPHGALYNMAARDRLLAEAIAEAVLRFDTSLLLYGLSGSELMAAGKRAGLAVVSEVFADRCYRPDGSLVPRSEPYAVIHDCEAAVAQALQMATAGTVRASDGSLVPIEAQTVCIHGDGPQAVGFAAQLRTALTAAGIGIAAPDGRL